LLPGEGDAEGLADGEGEAASAVTAITAPATRAAPRPAPAIFKYRGTLMLTVIPREPERNPRKP
jgi:hypothetical protein